MSTTSSPVAASPEAPLAAMATTSQIPASDPFPADPNLTFSLYADDLIDDVMLRLILPLRRHLAIEQRPSWIWAVRYARRGKHLKIRLHLRERDVSRAEALLYSLAEKYFHQVRAIPSSEPRIQLDNVPPIDRQDAAEGLVDDRTVLKTDYQRSFVNLGGEPLLSRDDYVRRMADSLSAGLGFVLDSLEAAADPGSVWRADESWRQKMLLKATLLGLHATGQSREQLHRYANFHRDCLLRFYVSDLDEERATRNVFDQQVAQSPVRLLRTLAASEARVDPDQPGEGPIGQWRAAIATLWRYLEPFDGDPELMTHPVAEHVGWPPLFKVLHGVANQIGLAPLKEAFVHHLLARVFDVDASPPSHDATDDTAAGTAGGGAS